MEKIDEEKGTFSCFFRRPQCYGEVAEKKGERALWLATGRNLFWYRAPAPNWGSASALRKIIVRSENLKESFFIETTFLWLQLYHQMKKK